MNPQEIASICEGSLAIDVRQLAKLLGISPRHVERLDEDGKLPSPIRLGRAKRWPLDGPAGIREWLAQGCPARETMKGGSDE